MRKGLKIRCEQFGGHRGIGTAASIIHGALRLEGIRARTRGLVSLSSDVNNLSKTTHLLAHQHGPCMDEIMKSLILGVLFCCDVLCLWERVFFDLGVDSGLL